FGLGFVVAIIIVLLLAGPVRPESSSFRFTPFSFEAGSQSNAVWSQDGKAIAYMASTDPLQPQQIFVRYLDSPVGKQITHLKETATPIAWTPDGRRIVFASGHKPSGIWSVAVVGGEPESLMEMDARDAFSPTTIASDFSAAAVLHGEDDGRIGVWITTPIGTPLKKYVPDPFSTLAFLNRPMMAFSPNQKQILLLMNSADRGREEAWLMPYPAYPMLYPSL